MKTMFDLYECVRDVGGKTCVNFVLWTWQNCIISHMKFLLSYIKLKKKNIWNTYKYIYIYIYVMHTYRLLICVFTPLTHSMN